MIKLQFITHYTDRYTYYDGARMALEGGCRWIQLRMKDKTEEEIKQEALRIQKLCRQYNATFIIDDHVNLVKELHADGVHLGKKDMPVSEARQILGQGMIIGATANTFEDIVIAKQSGADYIGLGPFRFTTTKKGLSPILGLDGYKTIMKKMDEASIDIPVVAIGGITKEDVPQIIRTGVNGIAISGAVLRAEDGAKEMESFLNITIE